MKLTKCLFIISSIFLLSYSSGSTSAAESDVIDKEGRVSKPLDSFKPTLLLELQECVSPVGVWQKFIDDFDAAGECNSASPSSYAVLTTIDNVSGYPVSRSLDITPLLEEDSFSFHTNPDSYKMKHINALNKVALYQIWDTPQYSRQITLSGTVSPTVKSDSIDIHIPQEGRYQSNWHHHHLIPTEATVSDLRQYYDSDKTGYCMVESAVYKKQSNGKWLCEKKPPYVAKNYYFNLVSPLM